MNIWGATSSKKNTRAIIAPTTTVIVVSDTIQKINQAVRRGTIPTYGSAYNYYSKHIIASYPTQRSLSGTQRTSEKIPNGDSVKFSIQSRSHCGQSIPECQCEMVAFWSRT